LIAGAIEVRASVLERALIPDGSKKRPGKHCSRAYEFGDEGKTGKLLFVGEMPAAHRAHTDQARAQQHQGTRRIGRAER
jgi:hypothetical protein